jgi:hypothetical protein
MLFPAILSVRETSRRNICLKNMQTLGVALHQYYDEHKRFPPSSGVTRNGKGDITAVDGWSWIALILPQLETGSSEEHTESINKNNFYKKMDIEYGRPLVEKPESQGTPHADALATSIENLLCPSSSSCPYADPKTKKEAITNYKAMGATHFESLSIASPHPQKPKYIPGLPSIADAPWEERARECHPDGAMFPGTGISCNKIPNGTSYVFFVVETLEPRFARWTVGSEATVVGLPRDVEFEEFNVGDENYKRILYMPKGYRYAFQPNAEADRTYWTYRTFLNWDYDKSPYDGIDGAQGGYYGPSGNHGDGVNHLFGDGSCRSVKKDIDVNLYKTYITPRLERQ